ncbi:class I SAM-dependent methyltransferase [Alicyclobacillus fastidiosus]|uniref:Class I SAM-dependent methyltransferase n=1 Tax=Alicyclobacillus fastidiosus TaxID=392011 RepID=A0ABY6ZP29_9BACL|nr:class I SAM-dependent methyltransferase [Alicyclobacillus fastidiosus]WAH44644.1 class I SAM-dependent methyltransferase [Alicyclobacillus fastidiosus]
MTTPLPAIATAPRNATARQIELAATLAKHFGVRYVARDDLGLEQLYEAYGVEAIIVADDPVKLWHRKAATPLFFHPSMGAQRIERIERGETDRLLKVMGVQPRHVVVDATLGLASDALVFARQVGPGGQVVGIEASPYLYGVLAAVQQFGSTRYPEATQLLRRVDIHCVHHLTWLKRQPDDSVDAIYFDPMFRTPEEESSSMAPLRSFAESSALLPEAVEEAKRVARNCVVVKERPTSGVFHRLGLTPDLPRRKIAYGVWNKKL